MKVQWQVTTNATAVEMSTTWRPYGGNVDREQPEATVIRQA